MARYVLLDAKLFLLNEFRERRRLIAYLILTFCKASFCPPITTTEAQEMPKGPVFFEVVLWEGKKFFKGKYSGAIVGNRIITSGHIAKYNGTFHDFAVTSLQLGDDKSPIDVGLISGYKRRGLGPEGTDIGVFKLKSSFETELALPTFRYLPNGNTVPLLIGFSSRPAAHIVPMKNWYIETDVHLSGDAIVNMDFQNRGDLGDSGGPLIQKWDGKWIIYGVFSTFTRDGMTAFRMPDPKWIESENGFAPVKGWIQGRMPIFSGRRSTPKKWRKAEGMRSLRLSTPIKCAGLLKNLTQPDTSTHSPTTTPSLSTF